MRFWPTNGGTWPKPNGIGSPTDLACSSVCWVSCSTSSLCLKYLTPSAGNLSQEKVSKRDVFDLFHTFGRLAQISLKSAYGFVQYHNVAEAQAAMQHLQGADVRGRKIRKSSPSQRRCARGQCHTDRRGKIWNLRIPRRRRNEIGLRIETKPAEADAIQTATTAESKVGTEDATTTALATLGILLLDATTTEVETIRTGGIGAIPTRMVVEIDPDRPQDTTIATTARAGAPALLPTDGARRTASLSTFLAGTVATCRISSCSSCRMSIATSYSGSKEPSVTKVLKPTSCTSTRRASRAML